MTTDPTPADITLIARVLGEHEDQFGLEHDGLLHCTCGLWAMPFDHLGVSEAFEQHRSTAIAAALVEAGWRAPGGETAYCPTCGPGYRYGDEGCRHGLTPEGDATP